MTRRTSIDFETSQVVFENIMDLIREAGVAPLSPKQKESFLKSCDFLGSEHREQLMEKLTKSGATNFSKLLEPAKEVKASSGEPVADAAHGVEK